MNFLRCELPHPLYVVVTERCLAKTAEDYPGLSFPKNLAEVEADFKSAPGGMLTLVDDRQADNPRISFCTSQYELVCGLTQQRDAFYAIRMAPLGLRSHNQLVRGALRLRPQVWNLFSDLGELNQKTGGESQTGMAAILSVWKQSRRVVVAPRPALAASLSAGQRSFLANIDTLIDFAREVELEQAARQEQVRVRSAESLPDGRWRFALAAQAGFRAGDFLQAGKADALPDLEAVVVAMRGDSLDLRFYQPVEARRVQQIEWLIPKVSTRQYAIQHEAVDALRNGQSLNPHLLPLLIAQQYTEYDAPTIAEAQERSNPAQRTMIERALLVPDLLLALGPPGTGKTDTIRAIVARQAALGKKVLVTSRNNKAVDNVLEGLAGVQALRIGREEVVSPEVRRMLVDRQSGEIKARILANLEPVQAHLGGLDQRWPDIQQLFTRLSDLAGDWTSAHAALENERLQLANWQTASYTRVEQSLARQGKVTNQRKAELDELALQAAALEGQLVFFEKMSRIPLLGVIFVLWAEGVAQSWHEVSRAHQAALQDLRKSLQAARQIWESYRQFAAESEQALRFKRAIVQAEVKIELSQEEITAALQELSGLADGLPGAPALPELVSPSALETLFGEWQAWRERHAARIGLLDEWRTMLETRPQVLYPPLIRNADVVGATCIGIATDARFEDLEFDLVIADEAGQIQVMDLLVPLVRARRAVLVGDHLQLPPLVEPEIVQKIRDKEPENQELGQWLEKSLFELLIERPETPESHRVMLDTQYRMPREIADFISEQFYDNKYQTGLDKPHEDPIFDSPLVFVDTMKEVRHYEQRAQDGQGYSNPTEARIIADLLAAYQSEGIDAGVIVPYKKQAEAIRRELRQRQGELSEEVLTSRIATVDSFQGREQDVIIFGFTRSNAEGRIGFLSELRRLNVSLTRARRQLVLVGDSVTLSNTPDPDFARLFKALLLRVRSMTGAYLSSHELARMLH